MALMRLDKFISEQAIVSRKDASKLIYTGHVSVNDTLCKDPSFKLDTDTSTVSLDGKPIAYQKHLYIMLYKPAGILCVSKDPKVSTVLDLLPDKWRRPTLFPAGRLDKDTTGLVILTDDGDFAHRLLSPKKEIWKTYHARLDAPINDTIIKSFEEGTTLPDGTPCHPAFLKVLEDGDEPLVELSICEGKYHQVKRMFGTFQIGVNTLKRVAIGGVCLDTSLKEGESRLLLETEQIAIFCEKKL